MSRLVDLIDEWKDQHGQPSDASIARAVGIAPQTLNSWRKRGIRELPAADTLRRLAAFLHVDDEVTFYAAGVDAGYIIEHDADNDDPPPEIAHGFATGRLAARRRDAG
jgi:transcriptional regulator with XRE-family HTH domain